MELFDSHAHYDDEKFDKDRDEVIKSLYKEGITKCVNIGCSVETSKKAIEIAKQYSYIYATCGIHPSELPQSEDDLCIMLREIKELAKLNKKVVAIGEIGLDYHWHDDNKEMQKKAFIDQINLANELNLPVSIHTRDAIDDTINILRNNKINNGAILHCCPFNKELIKHGLELGYYISFAGPVTFKNSKNAEEIVNMIPVDKILIETDSPYLAPEPFRGRRNDSRNIRYTAQKIADIRGITLEEIAKITYKNAEKIFKM